MVFADESAFSQRPPIRATWAPKGRTPVVVEPFNWRRLSGIGAVLTNARATRLRWLLALHCGNIRSAQLVRFLHHALRRHRRRPVILLWDRLPAHRSRRVAEAVHQNRTWLQVEWLPAYAPELNPVEPLWDYLDDTALANTSRHPLGIKRNQWYWRLSATGYRNPDTNGCVTPADVHFAQAGLSLPGTATVGRNTLFAGGTNNWDASLSKASAFKEAKKLEFRWAAFNIFNHPQFVNVPERNVVSSPPEPLLEPGFYRLPHAHDAVAAEADSLIALKKMRKTRSRFAATLR